MLTRHADVKNHVIHATLCGVKYAVPRVLLQIYTRTPSVAPQSSRKHRSSVYRYANLAELSEVPGTCTEVLHNAQKFRVRYGRLTGPTEVRGRFTKVIPVPRVFWNGRTEPTEGSGTAMNVQNSQKFQVQV